MQKSLAKKIFAVGLAVSTALWGLAPMAAFAAAHTAGTNVLGSDGTVYMVTTDGQRRPYTSAGAFNSYGFNSFASVVDANADDLALPVGSFIPPQDGKIICSDKDDSYAVAGTCYLITGSQRAAFTSATVFTGRGYSFSRSSTGDVSWMSTTGMIDDTTSAHRPGVLVNNNGTVQLVGTSGLLGIPDLTTFNSWGFSFADVVPASAADQAMTQTGVMASRVTGQLSPTFTTGGGNTTPPPVGGGLSVGLASNNPVAVVIADGSANNTLLRVNLSAGSTAVSVTGINFTKTGFTSNTNVTGVGVYVNGVRHGNVITTLGADGVALTTFSNEPIVVPAGSSVVVEVRVNLGPNANSGTIGLKIASASDVTSNASSVSGTFPVEGNVFTTVDGSSSLASVTLDVQPVNSTGITYNVDANSAQRITKFRVVETTSNEGVNLQSLTLWNNGTAADGDVVDLELRDQTGVILATAQQIGKEVVFNLASPYFIDKGQTKDFEVWGKIVDGAARTIQYTVYNNYDLYIVGSITNTGILPTAAGGVDSSFPIGDTTSTYNTVTVGSGSIIFNRATDSPSSAMVPGATDQVLARYDVKALGENMEVRQINFGIATASGGAGNMTGTVYVKIDGNIIYSAAYNSTNFPYAGTASARTPSSYYVLNAGQDYVLEVVGSVSSSATASDSFTVQSMDITSVKRLITNDILDPGVTASSGLTRTVNAAALTVKTLPTPVATTLVPVANGAELANFELDASASGEDVRVSALTVTDTTSSTAAIAGVVNLELYQKNSDGSLTLLQTSSSTATLTNSSGVGTVAFNFTSPIVVSTTNKVTLVLKGNINSGSSGQSHTFSIANTSSHVTSSGATTGNTISSPTISGSGQAMSVGSGGTLTGSLVSGTGATPSALQVVSIDTQDGTYFAFKLNAQYEAQKITSLTIRATGTSLNNNTLKGLELYRKVGTVMDTSPFATAPSGFTNCASGICSYTWTHPDNLLPDPIQPGSPIEVYVKADIGPTGQAYLGDNFGFAMNMTSGADITAKGVTSSNAPTYAGGYLNNATANRTYVVPFTVVISGSSPTEGSTVTSSVAANTVIGKFKLQNNGSAQVTLTNATFTDSGTNSTTADRYTMTVTAQGSSSGINVTATSAASTVGFGALTNTFTLDGGGFRYAEVKVSAGTGGLSSGDTFNLSVSSLGNLTYSVTEASLGYDANQDGDLSDTVTGLYVDGIPVLGTIQKQ